MHPILLGLIFKVHHNYRLLIHKLQKDDSPEQRTK